MRSGDRFGRPSANLSLSRLLWQLRGSLWTGFVLAVVMHLALSQLRGFRAQQPAVRPLTTRFIKRQPRPSKPLEMKKRPRPKRRAMQRKMVAAEVRAEGRQPSSELQPVQVLRALARPRAVVNRRASFLQTALEPAGVFAQAVTSAKESKDEVNMSLEMVDVEALDTGEYHAMVIQDPTDKKNVRGFLHLALAYPLSMRLRNLGSLEDRVNYGIVRLARRMNEWTPIGCRLIPGSSSGRRGCTCGSL